ncbi:MAG: Toxin-antitoxin system antitoxin component, family [Candidatus Eremiobacteraeota bacterium]|nr:Toxin-antitoxin system antitoxin component, family [Candidatus Eremiobacteraeota bacterium]
MTDEIGTNVQKEGIRSFALLSLWSDILTALEGAAPERVIDRTSGAATRDDGPPSVPAPLYRLVVLDQRSTATSNVSLLPGIDAHRAIGEHADIKSDNIVLSALARLPADERAVVDLYYFARSPLKDIKSALNTSESGVSQIHVRAINRLRAAVSNVMHGAGARSKEVDALEAVPDWFRSISAASESTAIRNGLPAVTWNELQLLGFTRDEIANVVGTSEKTIQRKVSTSERLGTAEGDRTMRLIRIMLQALETFGDADKAFAWLRRANRALHGQTPLAAMVTEAGASLIRRALGVIAYGGVA